MRAALRAAVSVELGIEARPFRQHVRREEVLARREAARVAVLKADLHLAVQNEYPLRLGGAVKVAAEADGTVPQLKAGGGQQRGQPGLRRALAERHALFPPFRLAIAIG